MSRFTKNGVQQKSYELDNDYRIALMNKEKNDFILRKLKKKERKTYFRRKAELDNSFEVAMQND